MLNPLPISKWNEAAAAHLLNRAGFGGSPADIQQLTARGLEGAVAWLVDYEKTPDETTAPVWAKPDPSQFERRAALRNATEEERRKQRQMEQQEQQQQIRELRYWWLQRMASGPRPLQEKLTLFWHGHFATSVQKVRDGYFMWLQNDTFRQNASGSWMALLRAASKDPAMLIWLDQAQSRQQNPNENFARELMELFTLGEGNYTEKDVTEAARALTGWSVDRPKQEYAYRVAVHDNATKTIFGHTGFYGGEEVLKLILERPEADRFIVAKLWSFFASENPSTRLLEELAGGFRRTGQEFKPLLRRMFMSEEFYSEAVVRQQVKSPVQWLVSSVRVLERGLPPAQPSINALRVLGQELFAPPNVKGWDGGLSWITTNNLLARYNYAAFLVLGENPGEMGARMPRREGRNRPLPRGAAIAPQKIVAAEQRKDSATLVQSLERRLLGTRLPEKREQVFLDYLKANEPLDDVDILHLIRLIMSTPEYQLA